MAVTVIPAILTDDLTDLTSKLRRIESCASPLHLDVADGRFVSSTTLPLATLVQATTSLVTDFHLMVADPLGEVAQQIFPAKSRVVVHVEALTDPAMTAKFIDLMKPWLDLAINPDTPLAPYLALMAQVGRVQVMGVEPGQQGAAFIPTTTQRVREIRVTHPELEITVDGGVNRKNITELVGAGADYLVVGSAIWKTDDPVAAYQELVDLTQSV